MWQIIVAIIVIGVFLDGQVKAHDEAQKRALKNIEDELYYQTHPYERPGRD